MSYSNGVKAYYAAELTFYLSSTFMLVLWEERRKDFHVMMLHHLMSVFLIAASYTTRYAVTPLLYSLAWACGVMGADIGMLSGTILQWARLVALHRHLPISHVMMLHHLMSVVLIGASYSTKYAEAPSLHSLCGQAAGMLRAHHHLLKTLGPVLQ